MQHLHMLTRMTGKDGSTLDTTYSVQEDGKVLFLRGGGKVLSVKNTCLRIFSGNVDSANELKHFLHY